MIGRCLVKTRSSTYDVYVLQILYRSIHNIYETSCCESLTIFAHATVGAGVGRSYTSNDSKAPFSSVASSFFGAVESNVMIELSVSVILPGPAMFRASNGPEQARSS